MWQALLLDVVEHPDAAGCGRHGQCHPARHRPWACVRCRRHDCINIRQAHPGRVLDRSAAFRAGRGGSCSAGLQAGRGHPRPQASRGSRAQRDRAAGRRRRSSVILAGCRHASLAVSSSEDRSCGCRRPPRSRRCTSGQAAPAVKTRTAKPVVISSANGNYVKNGGTKTCVETAFAAMTGGTDVLEALIAGVNIVELDPRGHERRATAACRTPTASCSSTRAACTDRRSGPAALPRSKACGRRRRWRTR